MAIKRIWEKTIDAETASKIRAGLGEGEHKIVIYLSSEFGKSTFISLCVGYERILDGMCYTHSATPKHSIPLKARINGRTPQDRAREIVRESLNFDIQRAKEKVGLSGHPYFTAMEEYLTQLS